MWAPTKLGLHRRPRRPPRGQASDPSPGGPMPPPKPGWTGCQVGAAGPCRLQSGGGSSALARPLWDIKGLWDSNPEGASGSAQPRPGPQRTPTLQGLLWGLLPIGGICSKGGGVVGGPWGPGCTPGHPVTTRFHGGPGTGPSTVIPPAPLSGPSGRRVRGRHVSGSRGWGCPRGGGAGAGDSIRRQAGPALPPRDAGGFRAGAPGRRAPRGLPPPQPGRVVPGSLAFGEEVTNR